MNWQARAELSEANEESSAYELDAAYERIRALESALRDVREQRDYIRAAADRAATVDAEQIRRLIAQRDAQ